MPGITKAMLKYYKEMEFEQWVRFCSKNKNSQQLKELLKMSLSDYSDIEQEVKEAPEPKILHAGTEVKVRIIGCREGVSDKNDCAYHMPTFDVPDDPMVMEFNDFFWELDKEKLELKQYQRTLFRFKQFINCFGIDISRPFSWEDDLPGKEGWVIVGVKKSEEYGDSNNVKKYIMPK